MKKRILGYSFLLAICLLASSCMKEGDLDFSNLELDDTFVYDLPIPLVDANLSMADLLKNIDNQFLTSDEDGLLHIIYRMDTSFAIPHIALPEQSISLNLPNFPVTPFPTDSLRIPALQLPTVNFSAGGDLRIDTVKLRSARLDLHMITGVKNKTKFEIRCSNLIDSLGRPLVMLLNLHGTQASTQPGFISVSLANYRIIPDNSDPANLHQLKFEITPTLYKDTVNKIPYNASVGIEVKIGSFDVDWAYGYFGMHPLGPMRGEIDLPIMSKFTMDELEVQKAYLSLGFTNGIGLPIELNASISTQTTNDQKEWNFSEVLDYPKSSTAQPTDSTYLEEFQELINDNLGNLPQRVNYNVSVETNPYTDINDRSIVNFFKRDARVRINVGADIPMRMRVKNLTIADTLPFAGLPFADGVDFFVMKANVHNAFPMSAGLALYFLDENQRAIDSINFDPIHAAPVGSDYHVIEPAIVQMEEILSRRQIENLVKTRYFKIQGVMSTSDEGKTLVGIYENSEKEGYLKVMLGCRLKANNKIMSSFE